MVTGETGGPGLDALRHVDLGQEAGQETVTIQHQLLEADTVQDPILKQEFVTQMLVLQVQHFGSDRSSINADLCLFVRACIQFKFV